MNISTLRLLGVAIMLILPFRFLFGQLSLGSISPATIDFTTTTTGIVEGPYDGTGIVSSPTTGQLDSDGVTTDGFSDLGGGSFLVSSLGGYPTDAIYHVEDDVTMSGDWVALSPGADDWSITFEVVNNSGSTIESIDVTVALYLFNGDDGSQDYSFSFGYDVGGPYQQIGATVPGAPASTSTWAGPTGFTTGTVCTGSITSGNSIFLRLSGSGTGRDIVGISSITLTPSATAPCALSNTSAFTATPVDDKSVDLSWTDDGSGDCSETFLVVARAGNSPASDITEMNLEGLYDDTDFTANTDWSARSNTNEVFDQTSSSLGVNNEDYFVFEGTGTSTTITGLDENTNYNFLLLVVGEKCVWEVVDNQNAQTLLPIGLIYFDGQAKEDVINLEWATSFEENNQFIAIERSSDRVHFEEIGRIEGNGNSISRKDYYFTDESPTIGTNYYRLRQVDMDGSVNYHNTIAIDFKMDQQTIQILRTISQHQLEVDIRNLNLKDANLAIVDLLGRHIQTIQLTEQQTRYTININDLNAGLYYLRYQSRGEIRTISFVKK